MTRPTFRDMGGDIMENALQGMKFRFVPSGPFTMGSGPDDDGSYRDEYPQHEVFLPEYFIVQTPITNGQYLRFVEATGREWSSDDGRRLDRADHPATNVTWHDAMAYCGWLSQTLGGKFSLPTEAQWEKAARGTDGRTWPWGDKWDSRKCNTQEGGRGETSPVGAYSPEGDSPYGCADMAGNVWEWTGSLYRPYPYDVDDGREDPAGDGLRVLRGGSWYDVASLARCAYRDWFTPDTRVYDTGFRCVLRSS